MKPKDRVWCTCGGFVPMRLISGDVARCECGRSICVRCREIAHHGQCEDMVQQKEQEQELDLLIKEQGYMPCSNCGRMIERNQGCPHMTCYCDHEFCIHCGEDIHKCNGCGQIEYGEDDDEDEDDGLGLREGVELDVHVQVRPRGFVVDAARRIGWLVDEVAREVLGDADEEEEEEGEEEEEEKEEQEEEEDDEDGDDDDDHEEEEEDSDGDDDDDEDEDNEDEDDENEDDEDETEIRERWFINDSSIRMMKDGDGEWETGEGEEDELSHPWFIADIPLSVGMQDVLSLHASQELYAPEKDEQEHDF